MLLIDSAIQTLTAQDAQFGFGHVQPTAVFGCVVNLQSLREGSRGRGIERLVQTPGGVCIQIVHHQHDFLCGRVDGVQ